MSRRSITTTIAAVLLACVAIPGQARAADPATSPIISTGALHVDSLNGPQKAACPSASQCTSVSFGGREATFDPVTGAAVGPGTVSLHLSFHLLGLACPSVTECVAVGSGGHAVAFDPRSGQLSPGGAFAVDSVKLTLTNVACPTPSQCTSVDPHGRETTFDPATRRVRPLGLAGVTRGLRLNAVTCPTVTRCTAVGRHGREVTFDPRTAVPLAGGAHTTAAGGLNFQYHPTCFTATYCELSSVDCWAANRCTAVNSGSGQATTFDPLTGEPVAPKSYVISGPNGVEGSSLTCASAVQCLVDGAGQDGDTGAVAVFNPQTGKLDTGVEQTNSDGSTSPQEELTVTSWAAGQDYTIACPTARQCTVVARSGVEATFDPVSGDSLSPGEGVFGANLPPSFAGTMACTSTTSCTFASQAGNAESFNPDAPVTLAPFVPISDGNRFPAMACPTPTQCTLTGEYIGYTFNPVTGAVIGQPQPGQGTGSDITCPTADQCTLVEMSGQLITFDPVTGATIAGGLPGGGVDNVVCPSATQCTATGYGTTGQEVTFDPQTDAVISTATLDAKEALGAIACSSLTQCTALGKSWHTFDPQTGATIASFPATAGYDIACPGDRECVIINPQASYLGYNYGSSPSQEPVTVNPQTGQVLYTPSLGAAVNGPLNSLACPSTTQCTLLLGVQGFVTYDPLG